MIESISLGILVILAFLTGHTFRKQYKHNSLVNCLAMLVVMTMSTVIGILMATWIPDMVLSTIVAMVVSLVLSGVLMYKLPVKIFIESLGSLFMGAMMGAMLSLMTTNYATLSVVFFMALYIVSIVTAIGLWNKDDYPVFKKAVPSIVMIAATLSICVLSFSAVATLAVERMEDSNVDTEVERHQH